MLSLQKMFLDKKLKKMKEVFIKNTREYIKQAQKKTQDKHLQHKNHSVWCEIT